MEGDLPLLGFDDAIAGCRQPDPERRFRGRAGGDPELHRRRAAAAEAEGRDVAAAGVDRRVAPPVRLVDAPHFAVPQGSAPWSSSPGGGRGRAGDPHRTGPRVQPLLRRRRRQGRLRGRHAGARRRRRRRRRQRDGEGGGGGRALRVARRRRRQAGQPEVRGERAARQGDVLQLLLPHQRRRRRVAVRAGAGPGEGAAIDDESLA